jgi:hypothetical protein
MGKRYDRLPKSRSNLLQTIASAKDFAIACRNPMSILSPGASRQKGMTMKNLRIAAGAAIFAIVTTTCAYARPVAIAKETNLRKEPSTESEILATVPRGTKVEVGACEKDWCKVSYNGQDGYMIAQNLVAAGPRPPGRPRVVAGPDDIPTEYPAGPPAAYGPYYGPGPYYYPYGPYYYRPYYYGYGYGWGRRGWW